LVAAETLGCAFRSIVITDFGDHDHSGCDDDDPQPLTVFKRGWFRSFAEEQGVEMPGERLSMRKIRELLRLRWEQQLPQRVIGRSLRLSQGR
jgi:hypothetical protein